MYWVSTEHVQACILGMYRVCTEYVQSMYRVCNNSVIIDKAALILLLTGSQVLRRKLEVK